MLKKVTSVLIALLSSFLCIAGVAFSVEHEHHSLLNLKLSPPNELITTEQLLSEYDLTCASLVLASEKEIHELSNIMIIDTKEKLQIYHESLLEHLQDSAQKLKPDQLINYKERKQGELEEEMYKAAIEVLLEMNTEE
ncbi:MAG: hypothetical protein FWJ66_04385 [Caldibacillus sp.]